LANPGHLNGKKTWPEKSLFARGGKAARCSPGKARNETAMNAARPKDQLFIIPA
jgi:hypothetical protein